MQFTWDIDPYLIHFGQGFGVRYYGLIFSTLLVGGFFLFRWQVRRAQGSEDDAYDVLIPGALGTVIGARLGHALFYEPARLLTEPLWIFQIWRGGLASHGALIGILIGLYIYARLHRQSYLECLDRFTFSSALGALMVRIGNFMNSEIVGRETHADWGVRFPVWDGPAAPLRHPSQLYEAGLGLLVLGLLFFADRALGREKRPRGFLTGLFLVSYFSGRFIVEYFKEYQVLPSGFPLTMGQALSIIPALLGAGILWLSLKRSTPAQWRIDPPATDPSAARVASPARPGKKKKKKKK